MMNIAVSCYSFLFRFLNLACNDCMHVNAAMYLPIRQLTALTTLVNAVSKSTLAHKEMIDSETLLLREKREFATHSQSISCAS